MAIPPAGPVDAYGRELTDPAEIVKEMWRAQIAQGQQLDRIEDQAVKTNGRVSRLESWRAAMAGGLAVVLAVVVPLFLKVVSG